MCKRLRFENTDIWDKYEPESVPENATHEIPGDFEIKTNHKVFAKRPLLMLTELQKCFLLYLSMIEDN